jgi:hypothetical protein
MTAGLNGRQAMVFKALVYAGIPAVYDNPVCRVLVNSEKSSKKIFPDTELVTLRFVKSRCVLGELVFKSWMLKDCPFKAE